MYDHTTTRFDRAGWEDHLATCNLATSTTAMYRALGQRLADWCLDHDIDPHAPSPRHVRAWSDTLTESRSMRDQARATVREYAIWQGLDPEPLRLAVHRPKATPRPRWKSLPDDDVRALLKAADRSGAAGTAVYIGLYAGLRRSEIAGLRWERVDLAGGWLEAWRPKNQDWHRVPLAEPLRARLTKRASDDGWLFPGRYGGHASPGTVSSWVTRIAAAAGCGHVTPHQLRHTCATAVYDATQDLVLAQTLLGHKKVTTTALYVRPDRNRLAQALRDLDWQQE